MTNMALWISLLLLSGAACSARKPLTEMSDQELEELRAWPDLPYTPVEVGSELPQIPSDVPPARVDRPRELYVRTWAALQHLPHDQARTELTQALESRELAIAYSKDSPDAGGVVLREGRPLLVLNANVLADTKPYALVNVWTTLTHESEHLRQLRVATGPALEAFQYGELYPGERFTEEVCAALWRDERAAYRVECELSNTWSNSNQGFDQICRKLNDDPAYDQALLRLMVFAREDRNPECLSTWARLAGHPHPEAFGVFRPKR